MNTPNVETEGKIAADIAARFTEQELMRTQDILHDYSDLMRDHGYTVEQCDYLFKFIGDIINAME